MNFYTEGILWYLFFIDSIIYFFMSWTQSKKCTKEHHWLSAYFPLNRFFSLFYAFLILWTGFTLYRMQIILFR